MNFDFKNTAVFRAIKIEKIPIIKYSALISEFFLFLFILFFILIFFLFIFNLFSIHFFIKLDVLFLSLFLFFWNLHLFTEIKIRGVSPKIMIADAALNPENYNLAEFLNFNSAKIVDDSIKFCKKKKIAVNSTSLFYSAVKTGKDTRLICFRLGIDPKRLEIEIKNYLEKIHKHDGPEIFSKDFQQTIKEALNVSNAKGHNTIREKEIMFGLVKHDKFFKKILIEFDLKKEDVENLILWLDSAEDSLRRSKEFWSRENLAREGSMGRDWSFGYTITLDQFSIDWRKVVSRWKFKEIVGHKKEIEQTEMILAKSTNANALIIGENGAGRKSIVQAIAQRCYLGQSLPELNHKRVVELNLVDLIASIQDLEKLEYILNQIFSEAVAAGNVITVIDNLHNFVGQKANKLGRVDISGILSKYLAIPSFQFIATTDYAGLHKNIEEVPSFVNFFRKVEVSEISETDTIKILQSIALEFEYKNKIFIIYPSIREIVNLTARYMPSLPFPEKAIDVLDEVVVYVQTLKEKIVLPHHVADIISKKTEIPVGKMDVKEKETLLNLENLIHQKIVNQEEAVKGISVAMRRARAGIGSKKRPMGSFLFLGPTGVGKTETSKALAQIYFGSEEKMIRLDMSEFQEVSDITRLIGSVTPAEVQGILTTPVRENPFSLVLLDEIEKSHPNILNLFLQILDEGYITDGQGRKVVFTNTIIICTSNAGAETIFEEIKAGRKVEKDKLLKILFDRGIFRPEFVNRFDATIIFNPLTKENLLDIAELMLGSLKKNLKEKEINFEITEELKERIVELSYKPEFGAREMRRIIQDNVENSVAQALLSDKIKKGDKIEVDPKNFEIIIETNTTLDT